MIRLKKTAREVEVKPELSLADRIKQAMAEAEAFVETKVKEIKASEDARGLPIDWIRLNIRATSGGGKCHCKCALALLEQESNG